MTTQYARAIQMGLCPDPECTSIHIQLLDRNEQIIAALTIDVEDVPLFTEKIRDLAYEISSTRIDN